jgi:hypothetical protein
MIISAAMGDFPRGGVKSFRNATAADALVVGTQIDFEDAKLSVGLAADTTTSGLEADASGAESFNVPAILEKSGNLAAAKESKA